MSKRVKKNLLVVSIVMVSIIAAVCVIVGNVAHATQAGDTRIIEVDSKYCTAPGGTPGPCYKEQTCMVDDGCGNCLEWSPEYP